VHTILRHMTRRLVRNRTFEAVVQTILDDVIALLGAEYGNIQLPIGDELAIAAQRGLSADFLRTFWRVKKNNGSACGRALRLGIPVIIPDIEKDDDFAVFRRDARDAGFRAVQSTPMVTKDQTLLGIVSTHFAKVHEPTPIEMNTLKAYGGIAAEFAYMVLDESYASLATKAEQMSAKLYARTLARDASERSIELVINHFSSGAEQKDQGAKNSKT
jgi:GAF domain-containing protein